MSLLCWRGCRPNTSGACHFLISISSTSLIEPAFICLWYAGPKPHSLTDRSRPTRTLRALTLPWMQFLLCRYSWNIKTGCVRTRTCGLGYDNIFIVRCKIKMLRLSARDWPWLMHARVKQSKRLVMIDEVVSMCWNYAWVAHKNSPFIYTFIHWQAFRMELTCQYDCINLASKFVI